MPNKRIERMVLLVCAGLLLLNAVDIIHIVDPRFIADYFGLSRKAMMDSVLMIEILTSVGLVVIIASGIIQAFSGAKNPTSEAARGAVEYVTRFMNGVVMSFRKTCIGLIFAFVLRQILMAVGIFSCKKIAIPGIFGDNCGSEGQLVLLAGSMILFAFAVLPEKIGK